MVNTREFLEPFLGSISVLVYSISIHTRQWGHDLLITKCGSFSCVIKPAVAISLGEYSPAKAYGYKLYATEHAERK